jgi:hypothetical protein
VLAWLSSLADQLLVHGLSALWISGRLAERITEQDPQRLAASVSDLFVDAVLPLPERTAGQTADLASRARPLTWPRGPAPS